MSDLISRQAAIEAIEKKDDFTNTAIGYALGMAIHAVRDLPSAQPEIVRCRECRITQDERERIVSWLGKFCRHIDNFDISLNDDENTEFFKEKMYQQFGWEKT